MTTSAFDQMYGRFMPAVLAKCRRVLGAGADADDVAQEAFVRFWRVGPRTEDPRTAIAWLYRTCTRLSIDRMRRRRARAGDEEALGACSVTPEALSSARQIIAGVLATAGDAELEAIILCRLDGLTQPEAAELLGVSERTVRRLVERFEERTRAWREEVAQ